MRRASESMEKTRFAMGWNSMIGTLYYSFFLHVWNVSLKVKDYIRMTLLVIKCQKMSSHKSTVIFNLWKGQRKKRKFFFTEKYEPASRVTEVLKNDHLPPPM